MGNHFVGKMFVAGLATYTEKDIDEMSQDQALEVIEAIGKVVTENTSLDAEFDDHDNPNQPLGRVLMKAFIPHKYNEWKNEEFVNEEMDEVWYNQLWKPFVNKFGFC
ncbi:hypothetical protein [Tenacibaculum sp. 190524A02b]|uniref:hypothetical protein n=1 Tax=Tenacibaculum vairaonense TaxID=3137860 RepID=UPI0031FB1574